MGIKNMTKYDNKSQMGNNQEDFELWKKIETFLVYAWWVGGCCLEISNNNVQRPFVWRHEQEHRWYD